MKYDSHLLLTEKKPPGPISKDFDVDIILVSFFLLKPVHIIMH